MTLQPFFEKFELFADAPDPVRKMRELVLQLAVKGDLSQNLESDGNAADIFAEQLLFEGDARYEISKNWVWVRFAAVGDQRLGKMLDQQGNRGELKPYLRNTNVQWMRFQLDDVKELRLSAEELDEFRLLPGDLLICEGGEPGRCAIWRDADCEMYFQKAIHRVRPWKGILPEYLAICLQVDARNGVLSKYFTGATIKHLTGRSLKEYSIPVPPLAEQKRIVAKVDELMALCDRLEEQLQERETQHAALARAALARFAEAPTPANLEFLFHDSYAISPADLRKSILALAVQGKLVPQDPNDEPASEFNMRLVAEKRRLVEAKVIKPEKSLNPISDEEAFEIPTSWEWRRAGDLCRPISSGSTPAQDNFHPSEGIPYLKVYNIRNQLVDFDYKRQFISVNYHEQRMKRSILHPGDVVMNIVGPPLGKVAIVPGGWPEWNCNQAIAFFRPIFPELAEFIYLYLKEGSFLKNIQLIGTAGQDNISVTKCKYIPVPIPPLAEQRRIVAKVNELMLLVDRMEASLKQAQSISQNLLQAIVDAIVEPQAGSQAEAEGNTREAHTAVNGSKMRASAPTLLSAEIVHRLHNEPTFGRVKHQKILHLCEHIAQLKEIDGRYSRQAAGPLDGRMIHAVEADVKKREWYAEVPRESFGHAYQPLAKAGGHANAFAALWPDRAEQIQGLIELMRRWDTDKCELFATAYAAWNDLLIWGREPTDDAILHEILERWHPDKQRFTRKRWKSMLDWIRREGYAPTGFGRATAAAD